MDKIYKRKIEDLTSKQLAALIRKCKQKKYAFKEYWVEVDEIASKKFSGYLYYTL